MIYKIGLIIIVAPYLLSHTCETMTPYNDVLIFGITTTLAAKVGAEVQNASIPHIATGYDRQEAVWMALCNLGDEKDSYSVFASFGATGGARVFIFLPISLALCFCDPWISSLGTQ